MAAIRTMKRSDKQKEPAALSYSKAAGSKWARGYVCYTTAFFLLPSCGRCFYFLFFCATWTIMATTTAFFSFAVVRQLIFYFFLMRKDNQSNQKQNNKAKYDANTSANGGRYRHLIVSGFIREEHRHTICKATRNDKASF